MDTTQLEYTAEDLISHKLQRAGIFIAKPKFDLEGTDLLAFVAMADGVKFCRIQCKGRSLIRSSATNVTVPMAYVTQGFVLFLFIDNGALNETNLYCFFEGDIKAWGKVKGGKQDVYILRIARSTFANRLKRYQFDTAKITLIKGIIQTAETTGEYRHLFYGLLDAVVEPPHAQLIATVTHPDHTS